jgi:ribosomal protein S12 methylthiotransferase accessory factor YcaO
MTPADEIEAKARALMEEIDRVITDALRDYAQALEMYESKDADRSRRPTLANHSAGDEQRPEGYSPSGLQS